VGLLAGLVVRIAKRQPEQRPEHIPLTLVPRQAVMDFVDRR
jgi:hypothetical protein